MVKYNYLKGNESDFPHIANVNTYKYDNDFDYGRFDAPQMELQICTVPWDMGEAHIGNRTISGIGNVVYFGSKEERDKWFDAIPDSECYRFITKFKELHRSLEIDVPIPYDMCAKHNYLVVRYAKFANENSPIEYEGETGLREWFWFVREVEFLAPSTTRLHLLDDAFQTWIYDVNVSGMLLERGHAPMFAVRANEYLSNPIENNEYLLTEDVNYGEASQVKHIDAIALNSNDMYACFATTANPQGTWGSKSGDNWKVPASNYYNTGGVPSVYVFAVAAGSFGAFMDNITANYPQFKQTVQAVFFASSDLLTLGSTFTFADTTCYHVSSSRKQVDFIDLDTSQFGYDSRYVNIAKLYTSPYAHIEVADENGNVDVIKIEDTNGHIDASVALSIAYPFVTIDAHLVGIGGNGRRAITFKNLTSQSFEAVGQWYETLRTWQVPTFAVILDPAKEYDYSSHFDRAQAVTDYSTAQSNANADADNITANAGLTASANSAVTARSNSSAQTESGLIQTNNSAMNLAGNMIVGFSATSTIAANEQQGAISALTQVGTAAIGAISNPNPVGAVASIGNGIIGAAGTLASTAIANGQTSVQASYTQAGNNASTAGANALTADKTNNQTSANSDIADIQNNLTTGSAANTSATMKANASRTASAAQSAIDNGISQAALRSPFMYGSFSNGDSSTTKPMALFAHVVTQSKSAISSAGDEFMRYGYTFDKQWEFDGNWNIGKYFTYWKLRDFWVSNLNVPDMYMDKLRFFLFGGVTVWRKPEYIGHVSVYDNFN